VLISSPQILTRIPASAHACRPIYNVIVSNVPGSASAGCTSWARRWSYYPISALAQDMRSTSPC